MQKFKPIEIVKKTHVMSRAAIDLLQNFAIRKLSTIAVVDFYGKGAQEEFATRIRTRKTYKWCKEVKGCTVAMKCHAV